MPQCAKCKSKSIYKDGHIHHEKGCIYWDEAPQTVETANPVECQIVREAHKFTEKDMLRAFRHGIEFEQTGENGKDMPPDMPDKHLPFWEWLRRNYT